MAAIGLALVVDDDPGSRKLMRHACRSLGFEVHEASRGDEGYSFIEKGNYDIILSDDMMPGMDGVELVELSRKKNPDIPIVLISGYASVERSVKAMNSGADYVIEKPIKPSALIETLSWILEKKKAKPKKTSPVRPKNSEEATRNLIVSKFEGRMAELLFLIDRVACTDSTVLISGESGTGKELVAHAIHDASRRKNGPFVPVNCGAIPETLLESELFGHSRGAFSGAFREKPGRFALADKGTIFLDEVGEMSAAFQVKLLRVLQDHSFEPVGGTKVQHADFRVLAATNRDLSKEVETGRFREDLFYRLNVIDIQVPPLRERKEDTSLLIDHFIKRFNHRHQLNTRIVDKKLLKVMQTHPWPGNVRELENLVERLCILKNVGDIDVDDLPPRYVESRLKANSFSQVDLPTEGSFSQVDLPTEGLDFNEAVDEFERRMISKALAQSNGNKSRAASLLGLNRTTLVEKLKKKGIK